MLKPLGVKNVWENVMSALPERKVKQLENMKVTGTDLEGKKVLFFGTSLNKAKKGDKVYLQVGRNLSKAIKDNKATGVLSEINELVMNETRSFFYVGIIA